jgi:hypothetical protein
VARVAAVVMVEVDEVVFFLRGGEVGSARPPCEPWDERDPGLGGKLMRGSSLLGGASARLGAGCILLCP